MSAAAAAEPEATARRGLTRTERTVPTPMAMTPSASTWGVWLSVPTTLDEFISDGVKLKEQSAKNSFSGIYFPGQDWRNALPYIWAAGGDLAVQKDGKWQGSLSSPQSVVGLKQVQQVMTQASGAAKDGNETDPQVPWCANQIGMLSAPGWVKGSILAADGGCPPAQPPPGELGGGRERCPVQTGDGTQHRRIKRYGKRFWRLAGLWHPVQSCQCRRYFGLGGARH